MRYTAIAMYTEKGGVAKTTHTKHLACALAAHGYCVVAIDVDSQCSLTEKWQVDPANLPGEDTLFGGMRRAWQFEDATVNCIPKFSHPSGGTVWLLPGFKEYDAALQLLQDAVSDRRASFLGMFRRLFHDNAAAMVKANSANDRRVIFLVDCNPFGHDINQIVIYSCDFLIMPVRSCDEHALRNFPRIIHKWETQMSKHGMGEALFGRVGKLQLARFLGIIKTLSYPEEEHDEEPGKAAAADLARKLPACVQNGSTPFFSVIPHPARLLRLQEQTGDLMFELDVKHDSELQLIQENITRAYESCAEEILGAAGLATLPGTTICALPPPPAPMPVAIYAAALAPSTTSPAAARVPEPRRAPRLARAKASPVAAPLPPIDISDDVVCLVDMSQQPATTTPAQRGSRSPAAREASPPRSHNTLSHTARRKLDLHPAGTAAPPATVDDNAAELLHQYGLPPPSQQPPISFPAIPVPPATEDHRPGTPPLESSSQLGEDDRPPSDASSTLAPPARRPDSTRRRGRTTCHTAGPSEGKGVKRKAAHDASEDGEPAKRKKPTPDEHANSPSDQQANSMPAEQAGCIVCGLFHELNPPLNSTKTQWTGCDGFLTVREDGQRVFAQCIQTINPSKPVWGHRVCMGRPLAIGSEVTGTPFTCMYCKKFVEDQKLREPYHLSTSYMLSTDCP